MPAHFFKTTFRFLWRQKSYSAINVLGLAAGLACSFFILLWVQDELRYDRFHTDGERLYRVMRNASFDDGQIFTWSAIPKPLAQELEAKFPEVTDAVLMTWPESGLFTQGDQTFRENGYYAGKAFFDIFSFPLLAGDAATALADPNSVVLSEALVRKYFGEGATPSEVIGQSIRFERRLDLTVSGVAAEVPKQSSIQFDFIIPFEVFARENAWVENWGNSGPRLFVRLAEGADGKVVSGKIRNVVNEHHEGGGSDLFLQPYGDMRLYSNFKGGHLVGGRIDYVRIFSLVGLFILLIAAINFMNLATARSGKRAREIGVRKSVGATQASLVRQFLGESTLLSFVALLVAVVVVALLLPSFNTLTDKAITLSDVGAAGWFAFLGIALVTGLLAGSYPALYLASFNTIGVLKGTFRQGNAGVLLRKGLVVFQFALSILLIIGTLTVYRQIDYIRTKSLGVDRENLVYLPIEGQMRDQFDALRGELRRQPGILNVTRSSHNPLAVGSSTTDPVWTGKNPDASILFHILNADLDYTETMGMEVVAGRPFSAEFGRDSVNYLINERAAAAMGMEDPVGQRLSFWDREGTIIGVVQDFHMTSLHEAIEPTIIRYDPAQTWWLYVRLAAGQAEEGLAGLEQAYRKINPDYPFNYTFLDADYDLRYRSEQVVGVLTRIFALLAVFIASLGLFGLASFTAAQRTKEIGIRKALGATAGGLVVLLSQDFLRLVLVAFAVVAPLSYFAMDTWLKQYAYRVDIGPSVFLVAGLGALLIAALTVSYQSIRAATADPVQALRTE